jgi:hypothetical protein
VAPSSSSSSNAGTNIDVDLSGALLELEVQQEQQQVGVVDDMAGYDVNCQMTLARQTGVVIAQRTQAGYSRAKAQWDLEVADADLLIVDAGVPLLFKAAVANREPPWMRKYVTEYFHRCYDLNTASRLQFRPETSTVEWNTETRLRCRPKRYRFLTSGIDIFIVNFFAPYFKHLLQDHGLRHPPCGHDNCSGVNGQWETVAGKNVWSFKTAAPRVVTNANGLACPLVSMTSVCSACNRRFWHSSATTLSRVPPEALNDCDICPRWSQNDTMYCKALGRQFEYWVTHRGGASNMVEMIEERGREAIAICEEQFAASARVWYDQMEATNKARADTHLSDQVPVAEVYGEFEFYVSTTNKVFPNLISKSCIGGLGASSLLASLLKVLEHRRQFRKAQVLNLKCSAP